MDQGEIKVNAFDNLIDQINDTAGNIQRERYFI